MIPKDLRQAANDVRVDLFRIAAKLGVSPDRVAIIVNSGTAYATIDGRELTAEEIARLAP